MSSMRLLLNRLLDRDVGGGDYYYYYARQGRQRQITCLGAQLGRLGQTVTLQEAA